MLSSILKTLGLIGPTISLFDLARTAPRTTGARHWHNPADPVQAARIEAAAARREERADKLARNTLESVSNNWAHGCGDRRVHACPVPNHTGSLNPFYIAK